MKKRIGLLVFIVLVFAPFALISQNVQADRQVPANSQFLFKTVAGPSAVTTSDMQAHPASSDPRQLTSDDLTLMLTVFSGIALLALYAVPLIMGGLRERVNA